MGKNKEIFERYSPTNAEELQQLRNLTKSFTFKRPDDDYTNHNKNQILKALKSSGVKK
jgi:hypothetical protein